MRRFSFCISPKNSALRPYLRRQAPDVAEYVYHWRSSMEYFMMKHFRLCLTLLETKFDAVGATTHAITFP